MFQESQDCVRYLACLLQSSQCPAHPRCSVNGKLTSDWELARGRGEGTAHMLRCQQQLCLCSLRVRDSKDTRSDSVPVLQASGGAAGDDAAEGDGQWPLPVSALRRGLGLPGQRLCVLQRLQEGKSRSSLADQLPSTGQLCCPMTLLPRFIPVRVYVYSCGDIICFLERRVDGMASRESREGA